MSAPEIADRKAVGGVHAASAVEGHCSWLLHTAVILLLVLAVGTILPIHHFTGLSLSAKEWGSLTVKNAELNFILTANMSGSLFHAVAGALLMSRSNWLWQQNDGTTKPVFFLGLFLGLLGLLLEWVGESVAIMLLANVLFGAMYGLCGTVLLTTIIHRYSSRFKATAAGTYFATIQGLGELLGGVFGVLVVERNAVCTVEPGTGSVGEGRTIVQHKDCIDDIHFRMEVPANSPHCICYDFRPTGPIAISVLLGMMTLTASLYPGKYLHSKALTVGSIANIKDTDGATVHTKGKATKATSARFTLNRSIDRNMTAAWEWPQIWRFTCCIDRLIQACFLALLFAGALSGAVDASLNSLNQHDLEKQLDREITPSEERAIRATNLVAITVFAIIMGQLSDKINRKSFVFGGLMSMVLAAVLGASAIHYQTDVGFRRGELFITSLLRGVGASALYGASIAAIAERSLRQWRAFAVGLGMACWELGGVVGHAAVDPLARGNELVALVFVALGVLVFGLFWVVAYKDERDELGAQEEAAALESDSSSSEDDRDGSDSEARP